MIGFFPNEGGRSSPGLSLKPESQLPTAVQNTALWQLLPVHAKKLKLITWASVCGCPYLSAMPYPARLRRYSLPGREAGVRARIVFPQSGPTCTQVCLGSVRPWPSALTPL